MKFTIKELDRIRVLFEAVQDLNSDYLEQEDYEMTYKIYKALKMRVPNSIKRHLSGKSSRPDSRDDCAWYGGDCGSGEKCSDECYEPSGG